ncbi:MAG TPA: S-methyl-5'-thioadenosine phosphorylase [Bacteroidetes bacterium]|nr:S-methyl-5'-thioadenosine phosphorylase [Bacteroidota bacterium]
MKKIGIIGGSGLEDPDILKNPEIIEKDTPYGKPSSTLLAGSIEGTEVVLVSRHGRQHTIPPTAVNNRANIHLLREIGCTHILASTACGSLREEIGRGHLLIPDQFIDFTRHRIVTFHEEFEPGNLKHTSMADPFDEKLRRVLIDAAREEGIPVHPRGTVITIEGPRFSTRAESRMFRSWGADVINMSIAPEVILANEAGIPYAAVAMSTDYDSWNTEEESVTWEEVLKVFSSNVQHVIRLLTRAIPLI